jgi:hypothetical protein
MPTPTRRRVPVLFSLGLLLALAAGCSSEDEAPARHHGPRRKPPAPMAGQEVFFDGKIGVAIKVGALEEPADQPGGAKGDSSGREGGGMRGGLGGSMGGMGGSMGGGGHRHGGDSSRDSAPSPESGGARPETVRPIMGSTEPPVMIHLLFTNHGDERVVLYIRDFVSPLGNFAVQPDKLALEPGQTLETEPMSSRLAGELNETDATLVLHLAGQTEKKIVAIHALPPASAPTGTVPAAPAGN